jgi:two-component system, chemotaxis family, chemotaxis protein CheY
MGGRVTGPIRRCLVVDDSRVVRKVARRILENNGYVVEEAENGQDALNCCRRTLPSCVLLDWNMPVMNGLSFLKALRQEFGPDQPLVLFCTTENEEALVSQALASGAQAYIMKPFDENILIGKFAEIGVP